MDKDLVVTVHIAGRPYRLKVKTEEEEANVRNAATYIEEQLKWHKENYHFNDTQDLLSMIVLQLANKSILLEKQTSYTNHDLEDKLSEIEQLLNKHTSPKQ